MSVVAPLNMEDLAKFEAATLWGADGRLLERLDRSHVFAQLQEKWQLEEPAAHTASLPSASSVYNRDQVKRPMTEPVNLLPLKMPLGGFAVVLGDPRSQQTYLQWKEKIDSYQDYIATMEQQGRYSGRRVRNGGVA